MDFSIDQNQDHSQKNLYRFLRGIDLPEYVKEAELGEVQPGRKMASTAYADTFGKYFPINNKTNVYISNAYFQQTKHELSKVKSASYVDRVGKALTKAASDFNITEDVQKYNESSNKEKVATTPVIEITQKLDTAEVLLFKLAGASELKSKVVEFAKNINDYPFEWRSDIASQFVKAAEEFGVEEFPDLVLKYAGQFFPSIESLRSELTWRKTKIACTELAKRYDMMLEVINLGPVSRDDVLKMAHICYETEKEAGIHETKVKSLLGDPVDRFFPLAFNKVASILDVITMGGEKFATTHLRAIAPSVYEEAFGFELDPKEAEALDILPTMPKSDVALFKQLSGIKPL